MKKVYVYKNNIDQEVLSLSSIEKKEIDNLAMTISIQMHENFSYMSYKKIDISSTLQIEFYYLIKRLLTMHALSEKIIKDERSRIFLVLEELSDIKLLDYFTKNKEVKFQYKKKDFFSLKPWIKQNHLEGIFKIILSTKSVIKNRQKYNNEKQKIVAFYEINNNSMINILNTVIKGKDNFMAFYNNEKLRGRIKVSSNNIHSFLSFIDIFSIWDRSKRTPYKLFEKNILKSINQFDLDKAVKHKFKKEVRKIYLFLYSSLLLEAQALERMLIKSEAKGIVLSSDSHKTSRLLVLIGNYLKINSLVLQHGTVGKLAFTPIMSNYFAAWGEIPKKQLISFGENEKKIITTGNVILTKPLDLKVIDKLNLKILVATNPIGKENLIEFIELITKSISNITTPYQLKVRLHPGEDNKDIVIDSLMQSGTNYCIDDSKDIRTSIEWSDIVLVSNSTVGIEALFHKRFLIVIDLGEKVPMFIPYSEYNAAPIVNNDNELYCEIINFIKGNVQYNGTRLVEDYLGGNNNRNALKEINNILDKF